MKKDIGPAPSKNDKIFKNKYAKNIEKMIPIFGIKFIKKNLTVSHKVAKIFLFSILRTAKYKIQKKFKTELKTTKAHIQLTKASLSVSEILFKYATNSAFV